jgi:hypothetical protein
MSQIKFKAKAQILVYTLVILMFIMLILISIVSLSVRNATNVTNGKQYSKSYNSSESFILNNVENLSDTSLSLTSLMAKIKGGNCRIDTLVLYCTIAQTDGSTVVKIYDTNAVENYTLNAGDAFNIVLNDGNKTFNDDIQVSWTGSNDAFEVDFLYLDKSNALKQAVDVIDRASPKVFNTTNTTSNIFKQMPVIETNRVVFNMNKTNINLNLGPQVSPKYLRIRSYSKNYGTTLSISALENQSTMPNQVRRIESVTISDGKDTSAPVVISQFPLAPTGPNFVLDTQIFNSVNSPVCGNAVVEGLEQCDGGTSCKANCCPAIPIRTTAHAWTTRSIDDPGNSINYTDHPLTIPSAGWWRVTVVLSGWDCCDRWRIDAPFNMSGGSDGGNNVNIDRVIYFTGPTNISFGVDNVDRRSQGWDFYATAEQVCNFEVP